MDKPPAGILPPEIITELIQLLSDLTAADTADYSDHWEYHVQEQLIGFKHRAVELSERLREAESSE